MADIDIETEQFTELTGDSSLKQVHRQHHDAGELHETTIIIDFSRIKTTSDEYFYVTEPFETTQYELYREINNYLYHKIPHDLHCRVPEIYNVSDHEKLVQVEDLGDISLLDHGYNFTIYKNLIRWLAHLHRLYREKDILYFIKDREYEVKAIRDEMSDFIQCFGNKFNCIYMIEEMLKDIQNVPMSICHRDFQPRNIMIHDGEPRIIDVQDMCLGPVTYDLACLLYDPKIILDKTEIFALMRIYSFLTDIPYNDIKKWTKICAKIRLLKSAGRHNIIYHRKGNEIHKERAQMAVDYLKNM